MAKTTGHFQSFSLLPSEMTLPPSVTQMSPFMSPESTPPHSPESVFLNRTQNPAMTPYITAKEHAMQFSQVLFGNETRERVAPQQIEYTGIDGKSSVATPSPDSPGTFVMPLSLRNETKEEHSHVSNAKANHSWAVFPNYPLQIFYASQGVTSQNGTKGHSQAGLPLWITPVAHRPERTQVTLRSPTTGLSKRSTRDSASISGWVETRPSASKMKQRLCSAIASANELRVKDKTPLLPLTVHEPPIAVFKHRKSVVVVASAVATFFILLFMDILA